MGKEFSTVPQTVPLVETKHRRICTQVPHPDSVPLLDRLREVEPLSMRGMPPIIWDKAQDIYVFDKHGNQWLDWSSGVLVTNAGHAPPLLGQRSASLVRSAGCSPTHRIRREPRPNRTPHRSGGQVR